MVDRLKELAERNNGILKTADVVAEGISKKTLADFVSPKKTVLPKTKTYGRNERWQKSCKNARFLLNSGVFALFWHVPPI